MSWDSKTTEDRVHDLERELRELKQGSTIIDLEAITTTNVGVSGRGAGANTAATGPINFPFAFNPVRHRRFDTEPPPQGGANVFDSIFVRTSGIILTPKAAESPVEIRMIEDASFNGQIILISMDTGLSGRLLAPTTTTGNINITTDIDFDDTQVIYLQWREEAITGMPLAGGSWVVVGGTGTGGGSVPDGTVENDHLEWNNSSLLWERKQTLEFGVGFQPTTGFLNFINDTIGLAWGNLANTGDLQLKVDTFDAFDFASSLNGAILVKLTAKHAVDPDNVLSLTQFSSVTGQGVLSTPHRMDFTIGATTIFDYDVNKIDINKNILPIAGDGILNIGGGTAPNRFLSVYASQFAIDSDNRINFTSAGNSTLNQGTSFILSVGGAQRASWTASLTEFSGNVDVLSNLDVGNYVVINEIAAPAIADVNTLRLYGKLDGGFTKLFYKREDNTEVGPIEGGSSGANTALSNLITTNINADLLPNQGTGGNIGSSAAADQWFNIYVRDVEVYESINFAETGTIVASATEIALISTNTLGINVPSTGLIQMQNGGSTKFEVAQTYVQSNEFFIVAETSGIANIVLGRGGTTTDNMIVGQLTYVANDSLGTTTNWARIVGGIVDNLQGDREGYISIQCASGGAGSLDDYVLFNEFEDHTVNFKKKVKMLDLIAPGRLDIGIDVGVFAFNGQQVGNIRFVGDDSAAAQTVWSEIRGTQVDIANGTEDGALEIRCIVAGTNTNFMHFNANSNLRTIIYDSLEFGLTKSKVVPQAGEFLGHFTQNETGSVGDVGTIQIPSYSAAGVISAATANTQFGSFDGASGIYRNTSNGVSWLCVKDDNSVWHYYTQDGTL